MQQRERVILYSDLNNFFASVETLLNPELKGKPLIVCGDPKERRGEKMSAGIARTDAF